VSWWFCGGGGLVSTTIFMIVGTSWGCCAGIIAGAFLGSIQDMSVFRRDGMVSGEAASWYRFCGILCIWLGAMLKAV